MTGTANIVKLNALEHLVLDLLGSRYFDKRGWLSFVNLHFKLW